MRSKIAKSLQFLYANIILQRITGESQYTNFMLFLQKVEDQGRSVIDIIVKIGDEKESFHVYALVPGYKTNWLDFIL